jgi:hypothetical protein
MFGELVVFFDRFDRFFDKSPSNSDCNVLFVLTATTLHVIRPGDHVVSDAVVCFPDRVFGNPTRLCLSSLEETTKKQT